jgi:hypothetical protein
MGERSMRTGSTVGALALAFGLGGLLGCGGQQAPNAPKAAPPTPAKVATDFEAAIKSGPDAFVALFDFAAVGEMEILLHRYDLTGRLANLDEKQKAELSAEDGTPYPPERERRNVGNFYKLLGQRTVGTGGCAASEPRTKYGKLLSTYPPLPEGTPPKYETLRTHANEWLAKGGVVGFKCSGGSGGLAIVYTARDNARGYDLITIYDD